MDTITSHASQSASIESNETAELGAKYNKQREESANADNSYFAGNGA